MADLPTTPSPTSPAAPFPQRTSVAPAALTPLRATFLMVGAGVGAGIMAVPALAERVGLPGLLVVLALAYVGAGLIHLMLLEVSLRTGQPLQLIELMRLWVLAEGRRRWLLWLVFGLLVVAFAAALAAYVAAMSTILSEATGLPEPLCHPIVYAASAGVVFFGLRTVGVFETLGTWALIGCVAVLCVGALATGLDVPVAANGSAVDALALFGMVMYGYYAFFSVPQVVKGLAPDGRAAARAVLAGLAINGLLMVAVAVVALGVSAEVTEVAIVGIAEALGPWAGGVGSVFLVAALLTTYWSVSLALADVIAERVALGFRVAWLAATLPSLLLLYVGALGFLEWVRLAAGLTAIVIALVTIPMYVNARRAGPVHEPDWSLGRWGSWPMLGLALLATLLMAAGSLLET